MELGDGTPDRYKKITFWRDAIDDLLVDVFLEAQVAAPEQIALDIDTTDLVIHGEQEGRFYHGYYDHYCYLPLYVFAGEHVLCARLRPSNINPSAGSGKEIERIVGKIRSHWPGVKIVLRGDSGFCREELMAWCEANQVDYVFGMARNPLLEKIVAEALEQARQQWEQTQQPARVFVEFEHETVSGSWSRRRCVVAKAEHIDGLSLVCGLRRLGLQATQLAHAQVGTIRLRLLKIGVQIRVTVRKVWVQMSSSFPLQNLFSQALQQLRC